MCASMLHHLVKWWCSRCPIRCPGLSYSSYSQPRTSTDCSPEGSTHEQPLYLEEPLDVGPLFGSPCQFAGESGPLSTLATANANESMRWVLLGSVFGSTSLDMCPKVESFHCCFIIESFLFMVGEVLQQANKHGLNMPGAEAFILWSFVQTKLDISQPCR